MSDVQVEPSRAAAAPRHRVARDDRDAMLDAARAALALHGPDDAGFCRGCLDLWARLAPACCPVAEWALRVVEAYGVATGERAFDQAVDWHRSVDGGGLSLAGGGR